MYFDDIRLDPIKARFQTVLTQRWVAPSREEMRNQWFPVKNRETENLMMRFEYDDTYWYFRTDAEYEQHYKDFTAPYDQWTNDFYPSPEYWAFKRIPRAARELTQPIYGRIAT